MEKFKVNLKKRVSIRTKSINAEAPNIYFPSYSQELAYYESLYANKPDPSASIE